MGGRQARALSDDGEPPQYTFGDTDRARQRLDLVAAVFEQPTRAFLTSDVGHTQPALAVDLGCGPGHTTRLLAECTGATRTVGLDASAAFVAAARAGAPAGVEFLEHDVTAVPFPTTPADVLFCRLLLAHLPDVTGTITRWTTQLRPGGLLAADEVEYIDTDHPVLARYEAIVVALVASRGGAMYAGPSLDMFDAGDGWRRRSNRFATHAVAEQDAASMYRMNLHTWRDDAFIRATYPTEEIDELGRDLDSVVTSPSGAAVEWGLRQVVIERTG